MTNDLIPEHTLTETEIENISLRQEIARLKGLVPAGEDPKPWSYWQNLMKDRKKANPYDYQLLSAKEQENMANDANALGAAFMDGDYSKFDQPAQRKQKALYIAGTSQGVN